MIEFLVAFLVDVIGFDLLGFVSAVVGLLTRNESI